MPEPDGPLLRLAGQDLYLPRWPAEILDESAATFGGVAPAVIERIKVHETSSRLSSRSKYWRLGRSCMRPRLAP